MARYPRTILQALKGLDPIHRGVEVGVWRANSACAMLEEFSDLSLILVDDYDPAHATVNRLDPDEVLNAELQAVDNLQPYVGRYTCLKMSSLEAAEWVVSNQFDFVYLDADHQYEAVKADIHAWLPKIREGGRLLGHDYGGGHRGVKKAVDELFGDDVHNDQHRIWWVEV